MIKLNNGKTINQWTHSITKIKKINYRITQ